MDAFVAELFLLDKSLPREKWCQSRRKNFLPISYFRSGMLCALNKYQRKIMMMPMRKVSSLFPCPFEEGQASVGLSFF